MVPLQEILPIYIDNMNNIGYINTAHLIGDIWSHSEKMKQYLPICSSNSWHASYTDCPVPDISLLAAMPGTPPPYDSTSSNGIEEEEPKSTKPYVIVGVIAAIVLIALLVFFIFFYPKNKASADNWEGTDCDSAATEVADSAVDSVDVYAADTVWTSEVEPSDSYEDE